MLLPQHPCGSKGITQLLKVITEVMKHSWKVTPLHLSFVDTEKWQIPRKISVIQSDKKLLLPITTT